MIEVCAWQAETRYEKDIQDEEDGDKLVKIFNGGMSMGAWGRVAMLEKILAKQTAGDDLRVLAAPEFMFRDTKRHFQTLEAKTRLVEDLRALSGRHRGVLLLPGTIPWVEPATPDFCRKAYGDLRLAFIGRDEYPSGAAKDVMTKLVQHALRELKRLGSCARVYVARNTLYGFLDGAQVLEYHKRYEAIDLELPTKVLDGLQVFFPPQSSCPTFTVKGVKFGVEICADHEYGSLKSWVANDPVDVHILVSDEVYPVREHAASAHMLHAGRVLSGIHRTDQLPPVDLRDLEAATEAIRQAVAIGAKSGSTTFGPMHFGSFPVP